MPCHLRTGKALAETRTEAIVVFGEDAGGANRLRFCLKPDSVVVVELAALDPDDHEVTTVQLVADAPAEPAPDPAPSIDPVPDQTVTAGNSTTVGGTDQSPSAGRSVVNCSVGCPPSTTIGTRTSSG